MSIKLIGRSTTWKGFIDGLAEGDCHYGDDCPHFGSRHGRCEVCRARTEQVCSEPLARRLEAIGYSVMTHQDRAERVIGVMCLYRLYAWLGFDNPFPVELSELLSELSQKEDSLQSVGLSERLPDSIVGPGQEGATAANPSTDDPNVDRNRRPSDEDFR